jgi:hypothetical protein
VAARRRTRTLPAAASAVASPISPQVEAEGTPELTAKGLRTRPTPARPSKPLELSGIGSILKHPYYMGVIRYGGKEFEGRHEPLISASLFKRVQQMLIDNRQGEKIQKHPHYLKGNLFCARCLSRLSITYSQGHGGVYPYWFCLGRHRGNGCNQPFVPVDVVDMAVATFHGSFALAEGPKIDRLRTGFLRQVREDRAALQANAGRQAARITTLEKDRRRLLHLYYRDR